MKAMVLFGHKLCEICSKNRATIKLTRVDDGQVHVVEIGEFGRVIIGFPDFLVHREAERIITPLRYIEDR